jgi:hypothetical protein
MPLGVERLSDTDIGEALVRHGQSMGGTAKHGCERGIHRGCTRDGFSDRPCLDVLLTQSGLRIVPLAELMGHAPKLADSARVPLGTSVQQLVAAQGFGSLLTPRAIYTGDQRLERTCARATSRPFAAIRGLLAFNWAAALSSHFRDGHELRHGPGTVGALRQQLHFGKRQKLALDRDPVSQRFRRDRKSLRLPITRFDDELWPPKPRGKSPADRAVRLVQLAEALGHHHDPSLLGHSLATDKRSICAIREPLQPQAQGCVIQSVVGVKRHAVETTLAGEWQQVTGIDPASAQQNLCGRLGE